MTQSATGPFDQTTGAPSGKKPWSALELAAMVGGFVVFWPLGLGALFLKLKNGEMWPGAASMTIDDLVNRARGLDATGLARRAKAYAGEARNWTAVRTASGNAAFDGYKAEALARLDEERRRLDAARGRLDDEEKEFAGFVARLRAARDRAEFERFMAERQNSTPASAAASKTDTTDPGL